MKFYRQLPAWSPLTLGALMAGFRAAWLGGGNAARGELDRSLRAAYRPKELYLTDSGTSALTLALRAVQSATGAPVALPAYCCYDVATAADGAGIPFLLYDIDPATLSPDLGSLRRAFVGGARSVVVAHLYGVPVDLAGVSALASEFAAIVVEDAAQGSGCEWKGRPAGAHGALGVLSFGRGKGVTGGSGGALLVNDEGLLGSSSAVWEAGAGPKAPRGTLRDALTLTAQWFLGRPWLYWIPASIPFLGLGETKYRKPHPTGGISALAAGVLVRTLPLVEAEVRRRRASVLRSLGNDASFGRVRPPQDWESGWLRYPVVLHRTADSALSAYNLALGVMRGYPLPLSALPGFGARRLNPGEPLPGAALLASNLMTIPTHRFVRSAKVPVF